MSYIFLYIFIGILFVTYALVNAFLFNLWRHVSVGSLLIINLLWPVIFVFVIIPDLFRKLKGS